MPVVPWWTPAGYRAPRPAAGCRVSSGNPPSPAFSVRKLATVWFRQISTINTVPETQAVWVTDPNLCDSTHLQLAPCCLRASQSPTIFTLVFTVFYFQNRVFWGWCCSALQSVPPKPFWWWKVGCFCYLLKKIGSNLPFHTFWEPTTTNKSSKYESGTILCRTF